MLLNNKNMEFENYFCRYYNQAFKFSLKKVSNPQIAEDLTMDAFVSCYQKFDDFDRQKASFATWLYVVLNNKIKNYYRDHKTIIDIDECSDLLNSQDDEMIQAMYICEMRNALALAMETLNETQKQIVVKKYFRNMSSNEIAVDIGSTPGNVRVQLTRAIKKLKEYFEDNNYNWEM